MGGADQPRAIASHTLTATSDEAADLM